MKKIPHITYRTHRGKLEVVEDWKYTLLNTMSAPYYGTGGRESLLIPAGFKTNGASVSRPFWILLNPFNPVYLEECTIHDFLCEIRLFTKADFWLEQLLIENREIKKWQRILIISAVRFWHFLAYQEANYDKPAQPRAWLRIYKQLRMKWN